MKMPVSDKDNCGCQLAGGRIAFTNVLLVILPSFSQSIWRGKSFFFCIQKHVCESSLAAVQQKLHSVEGHLVMAG